MKKRLVIIVGLILCGSLLSRCNYFKNDRKTASENIDSATPKKSKPTKTENKQVDLSQPVATYIANMEDEVTNNDFRAQVFPTENPETFKVNIRFGGNHAKDEVKFPPPKYFQKVALRKSDKPNTCIIGFIGKDGGFNEIKEIVCTTTTIKINALKAYYFETK